MRKDAVERYNGTDCTETSSENINPSRVAIATQRQPFWMVRNKLRKNTLASFSRQTTG
jgi:hypothetical protein